MKNLCKGCVGTEAVVMLEARSDEAIKWPRGSCSSSANLQMQAASHNAVRGQLINARQRPEACHHQGLRVFYVFCDIRCPSFLAGCHSLPQLVKIIMQYQAVEIQSLRSTPYYCI